MKLKLQQKFERVRQKKKAKSSKTVSKYVSLDNEEDESKCKKHTKFTSKHAGTAKRFKYAKQRDSVHWDDATDCCAGKRSQMNFKDFKPLIVETFD